MNAEATYDDLGNELTSEEVATGNWIVVRTHQEFTDWQVDPRLVIVTNNSKANSGQPFVIWKNSSFPWEAMQGRVNPTFAGSHYPFGSHMDENQLIVGGL